MKTGQDRASGAAADKWGRETASALAQKLGATQPSGRSNECRLDGDRGVIKCAAAANDSVGVTFKMLDRLDAVVAAFQREDGAFEVWSLTPAAFKAHMRDTRCLGIRRQSRTCPQRRVRESRGKSIGRVRL